MGKDLKGKELGKGISQRKDGSYHARFVNRFNVRESVYANTEKEIRIKFDEAKFNDRALKNVVDKSITLNDWYEKWLAIYKCGEVRENTKRHYVQIYEKHIFPTLGHCRLSEITTIQVRGLIKKIQKAGYKFETQNKVRILLLDMYDKAIIDDFATKNPARGIRLTRDDKNDPKVLTLEEQKLFFVCAKGTFYYNLFVVAINSGLRPGELFALTKDDIDFDNKLISVSKTLVYQKFDGDKKKEFHLGPPKTKQSVRMVPMTDDCATALRRQIALKDIVKENNAKNAGYIPNDYLFVTSLGNPMNSQNYSDAIQKIVREANLQRRQLEQIDCFSGHTFRHTFATRCIESGIQPKTLQKYLGHATLQMTMDLYVHVTEDFKQDEMQKLDLGLMEE